MNEVPFYFLNDREQLFAVLHRTDVDAEKVGWVICHSFAEEKLWSHRVNVNLARKLASLGYPVLRFDYRGYGDSTGAFEESTVDRQLEDIQAAIQEIEAQVPFIESVGLIGLRYGAMLAAIEAEQNDSISHLVLWNPVVNMNRYLMEALRANLTTQMAMYGRVHTKREALAEKISRGQMVNIEGYDLSKAFWESAQHLRLLPGKRHFSGDCQVVQIGRASQNPNDELQRLAKAYPNGSFSIVVEEQFWKETKKFIQSSDGLTQVLADWLQKNR